MTPFLKTAAALALALASASPAQAADDLIPASDSRLRAQGGVEAFLGVSAAAWKERFDEAPQVLVVREGMQQRALQGIEPFAGFDLGTDARGRTVLVYAKCGTGRTACDLHRVNLDGTGDTPIPGASRPGVRETDPTVSGGRLVYSTGDGTVVQRSLDAPASTPSRSVAGALRARSDAEWLELSGAWLATVGRREENGVGFGVRRLRVVDLRRHGAKAAREVTMTTVGLGGQDFNGPSFADGRLGWYFSCVGDANGCGTRAGTWRYALRTGRSEFAPGPTTVDGFVLRPGGGATVTDQRTLGAMTPRTYRPRSDL